MTHNHNHKIKGKNLFLTILLNLFISLAELIGGIISNSTSLISDAIHNFSDVLSLIISYIANRLSQKLANEKYTFGYERSEILAAFFNSATLIILAVFIIYKAILRIINPVDIASDLIIYLALVSIAVNALSVLFIKKDAKNNINIKSAYLHLFSDMLTSIAIFIGGILMKFFGFNIIDPILSLIIALYLIYISWTIFKTSLKIIMQFTPDNVDIKQIANEIAKINEIKNIHHIHIWQINEHDIIFEAHIDLKNDIKISNFENILLDIKNILSKYNINHITIQPEIFINDDKRIINQKI